MDCQVDLGDMENEVRSAEDAAKKAIADAQRLSEDLRRQQDAASTAEKQRKSFESQACNITCAVNSQLSYCLMSVNFTFSDHVVVLICLLVGLFE